jgi:hypothetical protein
MMKDMENQMNQIITKIKKKIKIITKILDKSK